MRVDFTCLKRGEKALENGSSFGKAGETILREKRKYTVYKVPQPQPNDDCQECWLCKIPFEQDETKILGHAHLDGHLLGWAHNECNLKRKTCNSIPIVAHNVTNIDLHHLMSVLHITNSENNFEVIPSTDEKYTTGPWCFHKNK